MTTGLAGMLTVMNRQIRRAQAKQDKKADREKAKKKEARQDRLRAVRARREERRKAAASGKPVPAATRPPTEQERKKMPGRFSGALMIATVFFIVLQAAVPDTEQTTMSSLTGAGFFLLFGYFSALFLLRRGSPNARVMTIVSGLALVAGVVATRLFASETSVDWLMIGLGAPGVVAGAFLGQMVFYGARR